MANEREPTPFKMYQATYALLGNVESPVLRQNEGRTLAELGLLTGIDNPGHALVPGNEFVSVAAARPTTSPQFGQPEMLTAPTVAAGITALLDVSAQGRVQRFNETLKKILHALRTLEGEALTKRLRELEKELRRWGDWRSDREREVLKGVVEKMLNELTPSERRKYEEWQRDRLLRDFKLEDIPKGASPEQLRREFDRMERFDRLWPVAPPRIIPKEIPPRPLPPLPPPMEEPPKFPK